MRRPCVERAGCADAKRYEGSPGRVPGRRQNRGGGGSIANMPELPDITVYREALERRVVGRPLARVVVKGPFLVRSVDPPVEALEGRVVLGMERLGKRLVFAFEGGRFAVLHLMIAGRLLWKPTGVRPVGRIDLAAFQFGHGTVLLTEAGTKKRASLHVVEGRAALAAHNPGGLDVFACEPAEFEAALRRENRTLKRVLTNPRVLDGIGNAYSDEILHAARLSPVKLTGSLQADEVQRLLEASRRTLTHWTNELRREFNMDVGEGTFPGVGAITAFRPGFAVHGKFGKPCPVCGAPVQRIVHAENETNYCAVCQCGGKVLADRSLSRLLKEDWPRTIEEWEAMREPGE